MLSESVVDPDQDLIRNQDWIENHNWNKNCHLLRRRAVHLGPGYGHISSLCAHSPARPSQGSRRNTYAYRTGLFSVVASFLYKYYSIFFDNFIENTVFCCIGTVLGIRNIRYSSILSIYSSKNFFKYTYPSGLVRKYRVNFCIRRSKTTVYLWFSTVQYHTTVEYCMKWNVHDVEVCS